MKKVDCYATTTMILMHWYNEPPTADFYISYLHSAEASRGRKIFIRPGNYRWSVERRRRVGVQRTTVNGTTVQSTTQLHSGNKNVFDIVYLKIKTNN
jgi:hypothetical protein